MFVSRRRPVPSTLWTTRSRRPPESTMACRSPPATSATTRHPISHHVQLLRGCRHIDNSESVYPHVRTPYAVGLSNPVLREQPARERPIEPRDGLDSPGKERPDLELGLAAPLLLRPATAGRDEVVRG
eukprot:scaffold104813_cov63-Phaeocystis_antarctica.AAC.2